MTFQPVVPLGGYAGWAFLQRTEAAQRQAFEESPVVERETEYFAKNIGSVQSAADLVADRTLMKVALGAFGLDDDLPNKAFVQKILEGGILDQDSLANRLADNRYYEMTKAFGFDLGTPSTQLSGFADEITGLYEDRQFEVAIGNQSEDMRMALGLKRDLVAIAEGSGSENAKWFQIMGNAPIRAVFETAFGLPPSFGSIDLEQQLEELKARAGSAFGDTSASQFADEEVRDKLIRRFFALGEIADGRIAGLSSSSTALTMLQLTPVAPLVSI